MANSCDDGDEPSSSIRGTGFLVGCATMPTHGDVHFMSRSVQVSLALAISLNLCRAFFILNGDGSEWLIMEDVEQSRRTVRQKLTAGGSSNSCPSTQLGMPNSLQFSG
jgi:hypothetical protein